MTGTPIDPDDFLADLDKEIASGRTGACHTCTYVPKELRDVIQAKLDEGVRAWSVYVRMLRKYGYETTKAKLDSHFNAGHDAKADE